MKSFSELASASQVDNADLVAISQSTGNGYASKKASVGDVTKNLWASNGKLGAKNLLPLTLDYIKQINTNGSWNNNVLTYRGITYTVNADAQGIITSIVVNGTATNDSRIYFDENTSGLKYSGNLLNGKTVSNDGTMYVQLSGSPYTQYARVSDTSSVKIGDCSQVNVRVFYSVANGNSISNETIYPMIRLANDSDDTFQPYAMTNLELTKAVESGGGGGTTVIPNPQGSPTDTLDTVQIGNTIYEITGGGSDYHEYSTTEHIVGKWIDNSILYEKTFDFGENVEIPTGAWTNTPISVGANNINLIIDIKATNSGGTTWNVLAANADQTYVQLYHNRQNAPISVRYVTLQYTKSS